MHRENPRAAHNRSVIGAACEVRLSLYDSRVIFCSVVSASESGAETFVVRPWGLATPTTIKYEDVCRAASVTEMGWQRQKAISRAQLAGVFVE
jgi:hypothetical protein